MRVAGLRESACPACGVHFSDGMNGTVAMVLVEWPDGRSLVVSLAELSDLSPRRLQGACIRLVSWCLCCGSIFEPTKEDAHVEAK